MKLFVDHLTVIDCSYLHPQHGIEGESWICDIVLEGALDAQSMVMDFGHVKKQIKQAIDAWVDHCLVVPRASKQLKQFERDGNAITLQWEDTAGGSWEHHSPAQAICELEGDTVNSETLKNYLETHLMEVVSDTVERVEVRLHHEQTDGPYYHYSHALKKHDGNCQRIAHGHRSKLQIWRDDVLDKEKMQQWCERWKHIYLVSEEDIIEQTNDTIVSGYQSSQGSFTLSAPASRCDILPGDSTVECIAQHIAQSLKNEYPDVAWTAKAWEGVHKGAMVSL